MIFIKVKNGLGNQLFCYALGEYIKTKNPNVCIKYDLSELPLSIEGRITHDIRDIFEINIDYMSSREIRKYLGKPFFTIRTYGKNKNIMMKIISKLNSVKRTMNVDFVLEEPPYWNDTEHFVIDVANNNYDSDRNYYLIGSWEYASLINPIIPSLQKIFTFKQFSEMDSLAKKIGEENSISIHIRKGDYVRESQKKPPTTLFDLCDERYYKECIKKISTIVEKPQFYIFSDDIEYARKIFNGDIFHFIEGKKDYQDLYLMSLCKHNIICNSTFSFWAAILNKNEQKTVIAPKTHYIRKEISNEIKKNYFTMPNWIYVDNAKNY